MTETAMQPSSINALDKAVEYQPFGSEDKIKLTARIVQTMLAVKTRSGKTCSEDDALKFVMLCRSRALNPFEGDAYLIGYDGQDGPSFSLITAHQAFLKRAECHPEFDGMDSGVIVKDGSGSIVDREGDFFLEDDTLLGGWATVYFKTRQHPMKRRVKLSTFNTGKSRWQKDPAGMIAKVAEADALRSSFPTKLGGLYLREEMEHTEHQAIEAPAREVSESPKESAKAKLNGHAEKQEPAPADLFEEIEQEVHRVGILPESFNAIVDAAGAKRYKHASKAQAETILAELRKLPDKVE